MNIDGDVPHANHRYPNAKVIPFFQHSLYAGDSCDVGISSFILQESLAESE